MRNDIGCNLRQGHFFSKPREKKVMDDNEMEEDFQNSDESDMSECEEMLDNLPSGVVKTSLIDYSTNDDE